MKGRMGVRPGLLPEERTHEHAYGERPEHGRRLVLLDPQAGHIEDKIGPIAHGRRTVVEVIERRGAASGLVAGRIGVGKSIGPGGIGAILGHRRQNRTVVGGRGNESARSD
jgi:hypothetical protein